MSSGAMTNNALLISIHPEHAENILCGKKTVELRRLRPRLSPGDVVVVYVSSPVRSVAGSFTVDQVVEDVPSRLWRVVGRNCGLSREEFDSYFADAAIGFGIVIRKAVRRPRPVSLAALREANPGFCPPQGYYYLTAERCRDVRHRTFVGLLNDQVGLGWCTADGAAAASRSGK